MRLIRNSLKGAFAGAIMSGALGGFDYITFDNSKTSKSPETAVESAISTGKTAGIAVGIWVFGMATVRRNRRANSGYYI